MLLRTLVPLLNGSVAFCEHLSLSEQAFPRGRVLWGLNGLKQARCSSWLLLWPWASMSLAIAPTSPIWTFIPTWWAHTTARWALQADCSNPSSDTLQNLPETGTAHWMDGQMVRWMDE